MICVRLEGGLGHQLFQYAAGRALALRHQVPLRWDPELLRHPPARHSPPGFELHRFHVEGSPVLPRHVRGLRQLHRLGAGTRLFSRWRVHHEATGGFDAAFDTLPDGSYLVGCWQSWRYFAGHARELAVELQPSGELSAASAALLARIGSAPAAALHIRCGDSMQRAADAGMPGMLPADYYRQALLQLERRVGRPALLVFSDDPHWCREHLPLQGWTAEFVSHNAGREAWQDLVLMAACHHHVIADSAFSWWGAWLADQRLRDPARAVFAPAQWSAGQLVSPADLFPPHWQVLGAT